MAKQSNKPKSSTQNTARAYEKPAKPTTGGQGGQSASQQRQTKSTTGGQGGARTERQSTSTQNMRTAVRRQEREKEKRRQQLITGGIIVGALVIIGLFIFFVVNAPAEAPIPAAALTRYEGIPQTLSEEGYPVLGDPNAPVQVAEYASFDCPHCREFHDSAITRIVDRVKQGGVAYTYVPLYGFGSYANGQGAAASAMCVAQQGKFWQFHDALFDWQGQYGNQAFTNNRISSGVDALQLDRGAYNACMSGGDPGNVLASARSQSGALNGFSGTPTIAINGVVVLDSNNQSTSDVETILARIESEAARLGAGSPLQPTTQASPPPEPTVSAEATSEATESPVAPTEAEATAETTPAS